MYHHQDIHDCWDQTRLSNESVTWRRSRWQKACWCSRFILLAFGLGWLCFDHPAMSQRFPTFSTLDVTVVVHHNGAPEITESLLERTKLQIKRELTTLLGKGANVKLKSLDSFATWRIENDMTSLNSKQCLLIGCSRDEKTILVDVHYAHGSFRIQATEYDPHFDQLTAIQESAIVQREMVPVATSRLALRCWTPVGRIQSGQDGRFHISFSNLVRLQSLSNWSQINKDSVLQPYRETVQGNQLRQDIHPSQFLRIQSVSSSGVIAVPIGTQWDTAWFQYISNPNARYLVRRVRPRTGESTVKVLLSGTVKTKPDLKVPRGGCDVYLHHEPTAGRNAIRDAIAVTDRKGEATFSVGSANAVFLTVAYENQSITKTFVPGVSPEPLEFEFRYLGNQSDYLTTLASLQDDLRAKAARINSTLEQISDAAKSDAPDRVQELATVALRMSSTKETLARVDEIEKQVVAANLDLSGVIAAIRRSAVDLDTQSQKLRRQMSMAQSFAAAEKSLTSIQGHFDAMRWDKVLQEMRVFASEYPDHPQAKKLPSIRDAVEPTNQAHANARTILLRTGNETDFESLAKQWTRIRAAIVLLLQNDDQLYLTSVNVRREKWERLVNKEIDSIKADNVAAGALRGPDRDDAIVELKARLARLTPIRNDMAKFGPQILEAAKGSRDLLGDASNGRPSP